MAGTFVGELTPDSISVKKLDRSTASVVEIMTEGDTVYAIDQDGCKTKKLGSDHQREIALDDRKKQALVRRVAQCAGVTSATGSGHRERYPYNICRAWNPTALNNIMKAKEQ